MLEMGTVEYAIMVFDIGKTNKKPMVFSEKLKPSFEAKTYIGEVKKRRYPL